ncbi:MAG: glycosyltransferase [Actinomycetota bacterium]|nr:glycosyltransferase [Actinomycetota bacterium]MDD5665870.1 glycosyltransferase [Actinomycetota bacterium]
MLPLVPVQPKNIEHYRGVAGDEVIDEILRLAEGLKGARVAHINSTAHGGGVAELLYTLVPLMSSVGLQAEWHIMNGDPDFFTITKLFHNALQGMDIPVTSEMKMKYLSVCGENASDCGQDYDFVIVHDPQPCALFAAMKDRAIRRGKWIWRCHIDSTFAQDDAWEFLVPYINLYDGAVFTMQSFVKSQLEVPCLAFIPPSIDPLSAKNIIPEKRVQSDIARRYGVDETRPIMLQVSRFDPWKDPLGLVDCYREVKRNHRDLQLVYCASMADDDPEGWHYYEKTFNYADGDPDIFLLSNQQGVGNVEVSAFQAMADVVLQKSLREGFGLTVTEAMWKRKPVVAGAVGGILLQVDDGVNGFLIDDIGEAAEKVSMLLDSPATAQRMGEAGHDKVRRNFLSTRHLLDYLRFFHILLRN